MKREPTELTRLRIALGLRSARSVARKLGLRGDRVVALEHGTSPASPAMLAAYAAALRADAGYVAVLYWRVRAAWCRERLREAELALEQAIASRPKDQRA
jgi:hypothetical protein